MVTELRDRNKNIVEAVVGRHKEKQKKGRKNEKIDKNVEAVHTHTHTHTHTLCLLDNKKEINKICKRDIYANASNCGAQLKNKKEKRQKKGAFYRRTTPTNTNTNYINKPMTNVPTSNIKFPTSNTAITLIALIITIIVLLILASVTLNMVIGENGIIKKAQLAKSKTEEAQQKEENELENLNKQINENDSNSIGNSEVDDELKKLLTEAKMTISAEDILNTPAIMKEVQGLIPEESENTVKNKTTENEIIQYEDNFGGKIRTNDEYSDCYAWKSLNGNTTDMAYTYLKCQSNFYIEYEFPNEVYALKTKFAITNGSSDTGKRKVVLQGHNEVNNIWENITEELVYSGNSTTMNEIRNINLKCEKSYKKFRLQFLGIEDSTGYGAIASGIITFQLYGTQKENNNLKIEEILNKMLSENNIKISLKDMMTNKDFTKRLLDKLSIETIKNNNTLRENGYELIPEESENTAKNKTTEKEIIQYEDNFGGKIRTNDEYSDYYAWKSLNGNTNDMAYTYLKCQSNFYIEYEFPNEVYALKTKFAITNGSSDAGKRRVVLQGYNEANKIWENITDELVYSGNRTTMNEIRNINLKCEKSYKKFRLQFLGIEDSTGNGAKASGITTFQLYGKNKK